MCLDGSPPGYYLRPGSGKGSDKWILHLLGGGWCNSTSECYNRSYTDLGSSKRWPLTHSLNGFLSDEPEVNPDFHDWNIVLLMYCDGASFAGDRCVYVCVCACVKYIHVIIMMCACHEWCVCM